MKGSESSPREEGISEAPVPRLQPLIDAIPVPLALLNSTGYIVATNGSWRKFEAPGALAGQRYETGANYLAICVRQQANQDGTQIEQALRSVIDDQTARREIEYYSQERDRPRLLRLSISGLEGDSAAACLLMMGSRV